MKSTYFSLFLISCCILALSKTYEANQAEQLRRLMNSDVAPRSSSWVNLDASIYMSPQDGQMEKDRITALPGQPKDVDFAQYGGYVTVDPKNGRALFYYFAESPQNSSTKPLVLWLNGGPGCSSLGYGALQELGPFRVNSDNKTLSRNPYAWTNLANILFLESPMGVGFSYSNNASDYKDAGDARTAEDSYTFLANWLERFPQYKNRDFYIAGEEYAGHYVPQLASLILSRSNKTNQIAIKLRGTAVGNGLFEGLVTLEELCEFVWTHDLISDELHDNIRKSCNFTARTRECDFALSQINIGSMNFNNIYTPNCHLSARSTTPPSETFGEFDTCSAYYVESYLNDPEVRKALHVVIDRMWTPCSVIANMPIESSEPLLPKIKQLIDAGISVWFYGGDVDALNPISATKRMIRELRLPVSDDSWRPWYIASREVGGYVVEYKGLVMATVKGAGEMVPSNQPERALTMFSSFLQGKLPPV